MEPRLKSLGEAMAAAQEERIRAFDFERARSRLLAAPRRTARPARPRALLALGCACALGVVFLFWPERALTFRVGLDQPARGEHTSEWIAAPVDATVPVRFSDGTEIVLGREARVRVVDLKARGATMIVERGELHARVVPHAGAHWQVFVGPFHVRVTGTRFDVGWTPETEHFSLHLLEGSVSVSGPGLGGERKLAAGEKLALSQRAPEPTRLEADGLTGQGEPVPVTAAAGPAKPPSDAPPPERERIARLAREAAAARAEFRAQADAGHYAAALASAERFGFERLCSSAGFEELLLLSDTARLAGDVDAARHAYRSLRQRFVGRDSGRAAFFLGRFAFDQSADYAEAARYFELSIAEEPEGPLAREASGRLIEARLLSANVAGAREASRRYLERYPDGPHAKTAKKLLESP